VESQNQSASQRLQEIIRTNRRSDKCGVYAVCSAHPSVIEAAAQQSLRDGSVLHVESTSSQVNQEGGYTGQTPAQFAAYVHSVARKTGLVPERVLLGGDHLGPYPWRAQSAEIAMRKACEVVRACVLAGYSKIHLDASMACADDPKNGPDERTIAKRAAILCAAAESAFEKMPKAPQPPLYVIGTEVPTPGGESDSQTTLSLTPSDQVDRTLQVFRAAFAEQNLPSAWERVIGLVVQPGVEFGENSIFDYDRPKASALSSALPKHPELVYEAHSTDYQRPSALAELVEDHFAILKVGPWLTFAFREAVFALSAIEQEWLGQRKGIRLSQVRRALDAAMLRNPVYWRSYYHGSEEEIRLARMYSYSDRCRYYWVDTGVQQELAQLRANLGASPIPLTLVSQHLPLQHEAIRCGTLPAHADDMIREHIQTILRMYAAACGMKD